MNGRRALACLVVLAQGCAVDTDWVRAHMAQNEVCPPERLQVKERPDVDAMSYLDAEIGAPRDEIAKDPARLAYWRHEAEEAHAPLLRDATVFEVAGCGFRGLAACRVNYRLRNTCSWLRTDAAIARGHLRLVGGEQPPASQRR